MFPPAVDEVIDVSDLGFAHSTPRVIADICEPTWRPHLNHIEDSLRADFWAVTIPDCRDGHYLPDNSFKPTWDGFKEAMGGIDPETGKPVYRSLEFDRRERECFGHYTLPSPEQYRNLKIIRPDDMRALVDCPIFRLPYGASVNVAKHYSEVKRRYGGDKDSALFRVLSGDRLLPQGTVLRLEWQMRVCVNRDDLCVGCSNKDPRFAYSFRGRPTSAKLHARYLNAFFVRRQRFEVLETQKPPRQIEYEQNLTVRQLPGRFAAWYLRSFADDVAAQDILRFPRKVFGLCRRRQQVLGAATSPE